MISSKILQIETSSLKSGSSMEGKEGVFINADVSVDLMGKDTILSSGIDIFITSPVVHMYEGASIAVKNDLYFFNVDKVLCSGKSEIDVKNTFYFSDDLKTNMDGCIFNVHHAVFINENTIELVCNKENYHVKFLEEYCNMNPYMQNITAKQDFSEHIYEL